MARPRNNDRRGHNSAAHNSGYDNEEVFRRLAHTDAELSDLREGVAELRSESRTTAASIVRIEQALLNKPAVNWVGVVVMVTGIITLIGGGYALSVSQTHLLLQPMQHDIDEVKHAMERKNDGVSENRADIRQLMIQSGVMSEQIRRIDKYRINEEEP